MDLRNRVLRIIASDALKITDIKKRFPPKQRREVHHVLHDLEYEGVVKPGWDWLYRLTE
jgi:hypothetical protein